MNQGEIITQIGYRFRTASRNFVTTDEIKAELNRSLDRLSTKVDFEDSIKTATITFTGDGSYTFTGLSISDLKKPIQLYDRTNKILFKRVSRAELYLDENNGLNQFSITKTGIDIESTITSGTLTLTYYSTYDATTSGGTLQKGLSSATDLPLLQTRFHDFFVEDVSAVLFRKQRKFDDYKIAKNEASEIYQEILLDNTTQKEEVVQKITGYSESYT